MTCTLATIAACLSLSNLYIETGVSVHDAAFELFIERTYEVSFVTYGESGRHVEQSFDSRDFARNPYGNLAIGYHLALSPSLSADLKAAHRSSLATSKDRGDNYIALSVRWFPWGGSR